MRRWLDAADEYIKKWSIRDVALLKICVCAAGVLLGLEIPKRHKDKTAFIASVVFSVTYVMVMLPFLMLLNKKAKEE